MQKCYDPSTFFKYDITYTQMEIEWDKGSL